MLPLAKIFRTLSLLGLFVVGSASATSRMPPPPGAWDLNDVSYLLPLPASESEISSAILASQPSNQEENLIPTGIHAELVRTLDPGDQTKIAEFYPKWAAVSVRFDPCFREHLHDACQKQVRVVWQPITASATSVTTENAALHTFYPVKDEEWSRLLADLDAIRAKGNQIAGRSNAGLALQIHPAFSAGGLRGEFGRTFRAKITPWISQSRLSVLAVSLPTNGGEKTVFKRFHVYEEGVYRLNPLWISYSPELEIRYGNALARGTRTSGFRESSPGSLRPRNHIDDLRGLLLDSEALRSDRARLIRFSEVERRASDPTQHASLSVDCLSCHATGAARAWLDANLTPAEKARNTATPFKNPGTFNLANTTKSAEDIVRFRAFGYEGASPRILDRVIFESATVADQLNQNP